MPTQKTNKTRKLQRKPASKPITKTKKRVILLSGLPKKNTKRKTQKYRPVGQSGGDGKISHWKMASQVIPNAGEPPKMAGVVSQVMAPKSKSYKISLLQPAGPLTPHRPLKSEEFIRKLKNGIALQKETFNNLGPMTSQENMIKTMALHGKRGILNNTTAKTINASSPEFKIKVLHKILRGEIQQNPSLLNNKFLAKKMNTYTNESFNPVIRKLIDSLYESKKSEIHAKYGQMHSNNAKTKLVNQFLTANSPESINITRVSPSQMQFEHASPSSAGKQLKAPPVVANESDA